ncbi:hypothetical protein HPB47_001329 [Ixodes persulcatus]|uniref:Uncharacterized protein n=1 Tax=Ixodes persulcatus TaxID=34615 RepID=A0AC60PQW7_IXOPE|nr:hypothetical protein HPB47_001329 [Ixodes persulcatus]
MRPHLYNTTGSPSKPYNNKRRLPSQHHSFLERRNGDANLHHLVRRHIKQVSPRSNGRFSDRPFYLLEPRHSWNPLRGPESLPRTLQMRLHHRTPELPTTLRPASQPPVTPSTPISTAPPSQPPPHAPAPTTTRWLGRGREREIAKAISFLVIQWNCRSIKTNRTPLHQWLLTLDLQPQILLLQETRHPANIPGYRVVHANPNGSPLVSTYIRRDLQYEPLDIPSSLEHNLVACAYYPSPQHKPICFLNFYNPPKEHRLLKALFDFTAELTSTYEVLLGGDFNAPNVIWGYRSTLRPGRILDSYISQHHFTLLNIPNVPTREGTGRQQSTSPDLTLFQGRIESTWTHTQERLLSDHFILSITLNIFSRPRKVSLKHTNWNTFRSILASTKRQSESYETWIHAIKQAQTQATKPENTTAPSPQPDPYLTRLWKRRKRILRHINQQPLNHQLRERLDDVNKEIITHCDVLDISNWNKVCNEINGSLHQKSSWNLLRSLLGPHSPPIPTLAKYLTLQGSRQLTQTLEDLYIPAPLSSNYPSYTGPENSELDRSFTLVELNWAFTQNVKKSAPGEDAITYTLLRNLPEEDKEQLLAHINTHWSEGTLPQEWKSSIITMIPKQGKTPSLTNLRPISLTSCVGKTMERMVLDRFQDHLETISFFPHTQIGFRSHNGSHFALPYRQMAKSSTKPAPKAFGTFGSGRMLEPVYDRSAAAYTRDFSTLAVCRASSH